MFTGIVQGRGRITAIRRMSAGLSISVDTGSLVCQPEAGESVSVDGVCLTVTGFAGSILTFDVSEETIEKTTLSYISAGTGVNIERALRMGDRVGGHMVTGHIDSVGKIVGVTPSGRGRILEISLVGGEMKYIVPKGAVAMAGISLTVAEVMRDSFTVAIIPHTLSSTTLAQISPGAKVNIEYDIMAKYAESLLKSDRNEINQKGGKDSYNNHPAGDGSSRLSDNRDGGIDEDFLARHGF